MAGPYSFRGGADAEYAVYVEKGHRTRSGTQVPARNDLGKAFDQVTSEMETQVPLLFGKSVLK